MKIKTPLHADHQLDQLAAQFEHWRQTRSHPRERIPKPLWSQAVALCAALPYTRVANHLRLGPKDLKEHIAAELEPNAGVPPMDRGFVEVPSAPTRLQTPMTTEIELQRPDGVRLRLVCPESTESLATVMRAFLEV